MYGQQPIYGQPPPPPMGFVPPPQPMMQPMMQPGMPMQQPMMQPGMPFQQPQQTQVVTTTTTQDMGADGKPGTVFSRNGACFIISIVLTIIFAASANGMNSAMNNSIKVAANRDEVYAAIGMKQLCDNPMKFSDTVSKTHKGKCVDFKAKWHIKNNVEVRTSAGFADNVIDAKCTETTVLTEMYVKYETCRKVVKNNNRARAELEEEEAKLTKLERATSNCYKGDTDCECRLHEGWMTDVQGLDQPYGFEFPTLNGGGVKTFTGAADNAVFKQASGLASVHQKVTEDLKQEAIRQQGVKPLTFGNTGKTEVCLTHTGGTIYAARPGFYASEISTYGGIWTNCGQLPKAGDYRMSASCHGPPSTNEVRIIGGLDDAGDRLGGFAPKEGVSSKNKEKVLIWETDLNADNHELVVKHQNNERATSESVIAAQKSTRNILIGLAFLMVFIITGVCIFG
jgi:hypothetical protein